MKNQLKRTAWIILILSGSCTGCMTEAMKFNESGYRKALAHDYNGAFFDFDLAIKLNDHFWSAYTNRGCCYYMQENYQKAMNDFNKSIELHPKNYSAYDNRGLCKMANGDSAGAIGDFRQALRCNKKDSIIYTHLGRLLAEMDSCREAVYYLQLAIKGQAFNECNTKDELTYLKSKCDQK